MNQHNQIENSPRTSEGTPRGSVDNEFLENFVQALVVDYLRSLDLKDTFRSYVLEAHSVGIKPPDPVLWARAVTEFDLNTIHQPDQHEEHPKTILWSIVQAYYEVLKTQKTAYPKQNYIQKLFTTTRPTCPTNKEDSRSGAHSGTKASPIEQQTHQAGSSTKAPSLTSEKTTVARQGHMRPEKKSASRQGRDKLLSHSPSKSPGPSPPRGQNYETPEVKRPASSMTRGKDHYAHYPERPGTGYKSSELGSAGSRRAGASSVMQTLLRNSRKSASVLPFDRHNDPNDDGESELLSSESCIPMEVRTKQIQRSMQSTRSSLRDYSASEEAIARLDKTTEELEHQQQMTMSKGEKKEVKIPCGLCEHMFASVNVSKAISYKAVLELRSRWTGKALGFPTMSDLHNWYKEVKVCVFCAQLVDEVQVFRDEQLDKSLMSEKKRR